MAPETVSTLGLCADSMEEITPFAEAKYDAVSPEAETMEMSVILPSEMVTDTVMVPPKPWAEPV